MKRTIALICLMATLISMTTLGSLSASASEVWTDEGMPIENHAYTFAFVGDTQTVAYNDYKNGTKNLNKIYDWIVDNKRERKIEFVFGLGDIIDAPWETGKKEWAIAKEAINKLNGVVPYSLVRGNHDDSSGFNSTFNTQTYKKQFDGFYDSTINNSYKLFTVKGHKYILITLDYGADDARIAWANNLIGRYGSYRAIITTHGYLNNDGAPLNDQTASFGTAMTNNGEELWEKCFSKHKNVFMVVCGHVGVNGVVTSLKKGRFGNTVTNILVDPQENDGGQNPTGLVLLMNMSEDGDYYSLEYYSTIKGKYRTGDQAIRPVLNRIGLPSKTAVTTTTQATTTATTTLTSEITTASSTVVSTADASTAGISAEDLSVTNTASEKSGCGSSIASTVAVACVSGSALAAFALRRREDDE